VPYLYAPATKISQIATELQAINDLKVGVCWKGNAGFLGDATRSPGITWFKSLFQLAGVKFFTLQPDTRAEFLLHVGKNGIDRGHEINAANFDESAALMMNMDVVITSCTSVCHLAGALGKPVWVVLPFVADFRWLIEREDSPWYPNTTLFRQPKAGDWQAVFSQVEQHLNAVITGKKTLKLTIIKQVNISECKAN
jgi:hypothetical protein